MTYKFNDSTLQEITDKILYQKNALNKLDADLNNLECFLMSEGIKFGEIDSPTSGYISTNDQGHFITFFRNDPLDEPLPFGDDDGMFGIRLVTDLKNWIKFEHFEFIVAHMKTILDDLRINV